ncbi:transposase [Intrasporangium mesophilum]
MSASGLIDRVRHRTRTGCPWRDVPQRHGPWWRVHALFACWQVVGVRTARVDVDCAGGCGRHVVLAAVNGLEHLAGSRARRGLEAGQRGSGCGRTASPRAGPLSSRLVDLDARRDRHPLWRSAVPAHPGQVGDSPEMIPVLDAIRVAPLRTRSCPHPSR